jgi:hypothetical protein
MTPWPAVEDNPSLGYLWARLRALEDRVGDAVERRRALDPLPEDPFRGLYVSANRAEAILAGTDGVPELTSAEETRRAELESTAERAEELGEHFRLRDLARAFELDFSDTELLLVALAPDLDPRFERLYGYLQDDVSRRRASIGLALELAGMSPRSATDRQRLSVAGSLVRRGLLVVEETQQPFLGRSLRVTDRVAGHLVGDDTLEPALRRVLEGTSGAASLADAALERALEMSVRLAYVRDAGPGTGLAAALGSVRALGLAAVALDLNLLARAQSPADLAAAAQIEARLQWAVLVGGPVDSLGEGVAQVVHALGDGEWPLVLTGQRAWDPAWSRTAPLVLDAPRLAAAQRTLLWQAELAGRAEVPSNGHMAQLLAATQPFHLSPSQIVRAADAGRLRARAESRLLEAQDLQAGAREQNAAGIDRLAHRVAPGATWADLVSPSDILVQLRELASRARHRERVLDEWRLGGRSNRGRGVTALFAGESGTGKTLAAEVIAADLGVDLYIIDLSTVVDKYIGETEKNLDRIFTEADRVNGVLLFDEADAIFGKRSEVRDARDRYANVEVAYLLQRMERFDGLAVLTTNLRANLDESFTRRIDVIVDFPTPDAAARRALWGMHLPPQLPQAPDLDLDFMAEHFELTGGNIRNVCLAAAFLAAEHGGAVAMADLIRATGREYGKLGRLTLASEFGSYHSLLPQRSVP